MSKKPGRAFLLVTKGSPHGQRESFSISKERYSIGRVWEAHRPDLAFASAYISRNHAEITMVNDGYVITDHSKHGTAVNGMLLNKNEPYPLNHGDTIDLAGSEVVLSFFIETCPDETLPWPHQKETDIVLDEAKREVLIAGRPIELTGNLYALFRLLYRNRGSAVDSLTIKRTVWPERCQEAGSPLVGDEEVIWSNGYGKNWGKMGH
jgi:hypothetical protein